MDPLHVRLQIPLAVALVATIRAALRLLLAAGGLDVFHKVMFPSIRFCALGALVPTSVIRMLESELAVNIVAGSGDGIRIECLIVLPDNKRT